MKNHMGSYIASEYLSRMIPTTCSWCWEGSNHSKQVTVAMAILFVVITLFIWMTKYSAAAMKCQLPPGPRGLPLVGNLPFLDPELHNYFAKLTTIYGPIFKLKLGSKLCVVIGSASTAKEVLKDKDTIFANRNTPSSVVTLTYGASDMVWSAYGSHWRTLRLICAQEIFCKKNLDSLNILRRREIHRMVNFFYSRIDTPINIAEQMHLTSLNVILSMLWGGTLKTAEMSCTGLEFQKATREAVELMWETNMTDFFPILSRFDIQGVVRRMRRVFLWYDCILESIINHRIKFNQAEGINKGSDFLDILLQHMDDGHSKTPITIINVKALLQDLVLAATDTTSTAVEWAMAEAMANPKVMKRIREELGEVVGENCMVEESHVPKLQYLDAVIKETHRLHPVVPFLVPRRPSESCTIGGYKIPKDAQILVNTMALHRDPGAWENPLKFEPERFLQNTNNYDYSGNNVNFIPFGSGRRICAGFSLAERTVPYAIASLLHSFEWKPAEGVDIDLTATNGIVLRKKIPLVASPTPRLSNTEMYL